jgi:hypothetical protein
MKSISFKVTSLRILNAPWKKQHGINIAIRNSWMAPVSDRLNRESIETELAATAAHSPEMSTIENTKSVMVALPVPLLGMAQGGVKEIDPGVMREVLLEPSDRNPFIRDEDEN